MTTHGGACPGRADRACAGELIISSSDLATLLVCAVRYAAGRCSTAPRMVGPIVRHYASALSAIDREVMLRDLAERARNIGGLGHQCDVDEWRRVTDALVAMGGGA